MTRICCLTLASLLLAGPAAYLYVRLVVLG